MRLPKFPFRSLSRWELLTLLLFVMPLVFIAGAWWGHVFWR